MMLDRVPKVNVQRLFAVALTLKVISSMASIIFDSPWILGLVVPLLVMVAYMVVGYFCRESDLSEERFADSCYYIGFIFTITSIVVSLFDLPNLAGGESLQNIATRFAAAMISTVLGMGVRVCLVSFRKDADDAVRDAEEAVLDAVRMLVTQLTSVVDNLKQFEQQVIDASKFTVENVNRQVEALGQQYAQSLNTFYHDLTQENKTAFTALIDEVRVATTRLGDSVDTYSAGIKTNLEGIERKVTQFADAVTNRLETTTFPDDYFSRELKAPLELLKEEATVLGRSVRSVSQEVESSGETIADILKKITAKTKKTEAAMDAVVALSVQHQAIVNNADVQLKSLVSLATRLEQVEATLQGAARALSANSDTSSELLAKVASLSQESAVLRGEIKETMTALTVKLDANATLASGVVEKIEAQAGELRGSASELIAKLAAQASSTSLVAQRMGEAGTAAENLNERLNAVAASNAELAASAKEAANAALTASQLTSRAVEGIASLSQSAERATKQVADVAGRLDMLDGDLRAQAAELLVATTKAETAREAEAAAATYAVLGVMADHAATAMAARVDITSEPGELKVVQADNAAHSNLAPYQAEPESAAPAPTVSASGH